MIEDYSKQLVAYRPVQVSGKQASKNGEVASQIDTGKALQPSTNNGSDSFEGQSDTVRSFVAPRVFSGSSKEEDKSTHVEETESASNVPHNEVDSGISRVYVIEGNEDATDHIANVRAASESIAALTDQPFETEFFINTPVAEAFKEGTEPPDLKSSIEEAGSIEDYVTQNIVRYYEMVTLDLSKVDTNRFDAVNMSFGFTEFKVNGIVRAIMEKPWKDEGQLLDALNIPNEEKDKLKQAIEEQGVAKAAEAYVDKILENNQAIEEARLKYEETVLELKEKKVAVVVAAGNDPNHEATPESRAANPELPEFEHDETANFLSNAEGVIVVSALSEEESDRTLNEFVRSGDEVDFATTPYNNIMGTSFSAPEIATVYAIGTDRGKSIDQITEELHAIGQRNENTWTSLTEEELIRQMNS